MGYLKSCSEVDNIITECVGLGWTAREIATEFELREDTVKKKRVSLGLSGINPYNRKGRPIGVRLSKEELISILVSSPSKSFEYFSSNKNLPCPSHYIKTFGSWGAALVAAGVPPNKSSMLENKTTYVYLVEFDSFYKVGITQRDVNTRLAGYPTYSIVILLEFSTLKEAKSKESEWLNNTSKYKFVPNNFPSEGRGTSECFMF